MNLKQFEKLISSQKITNEIIDNIQDKDLKKIFENIKDFKILKIELAKYLFENQKDKMY